MGFARKKPKNWKLFTKPGGKQSTPA